MLNPVSSSDLDVAFSVPASASSSSCIESDELHEGKEMENADEFFFWSPEDAEEKQVSQIGASACGATGVINVLRVLNLPSEVEEVVQHVNTHLREEEAPLTEYLHSRSVAGTTHEDLIVGLDGATNEKVYARFFSFFPRRDVNLCEWLRGWMRKGVVPVATLNLQRGVPQGYEIPDAWHHQMIYGVDGDLVHLCNPVIAEPASLMMEQLCSPSVLLIRREDIMERYDQDEDIRKIYHHQDGRWKDMKVLDHLTALIDEEMAFPFPKTEAFELLKKHLFTSHLRIPAAYKSGITLCVRRDNVEACNELLHAPELKFLETPEIAQPQEQVKGS